MLRRAEYTVYVVGIVFLGLAYTRAKAWFPSEPWFALAVVAYLGVLRIAGRLVARGRRQ
jgi:hypothetical protein